MKRFLIKGLFYFSLFLIIGNILSFIGRHSLTKSSFFKPSFLINNFDENTPLDYVILGSSRGLTTLDSKIIDSELNLKGVNLSMDDTDLKSHILMLKHFYNSGYKTKYCILTLDEANFSKNSKKLGDNDYRFSPFINKSYVKEHFSTYEDGLIKPVAYSTYLPLICYSYYNLQIIPASGLSLIKPKLRHRFDEKGNYTYPVLNKKNNKIKERILKQSEITNPLVSEILALTKEHGTELILYIAPYKDLEIGFQKQEYNIINHSALTSNADLFYDNIHVNSDGRTFTTKSFCKTFSNLNK